jgi:hypothetical protein
MRKSKLFSATAITLSLAAAGTLLGAQIASADTTISTDSTTPQQTSTTGNLTLSAKLTLTSGTAITVNSANTVAISGSVVMSSSAPGSTAILVSGGQTTGISLTGALTVTDSYTATDTNADGVIDGPWAADGARYGIRSTGTTPLIGNITLGSGSSVTVDGNGAYGVRLENALQGEFNSRSSITMTGDDATAISIEGGVTGRVRIGGTISALGKGARGVNVASAINGALVFDGTISGTGYSNLSPSSLTSTVLAGLSPTLNLQQSGALVTIADNVTGGVLFNNAATTSTTVTDNDGDGTLDTEQGAASLVQYGTAPALLIGSATKDITLNKISVASTATAANVTAYDKYALVIRGSVATSGLYKGVSSSGIVIGGLGHAVNLENGILLNGTVSSSAVDADTHGLWLQAGANVPKFEISGSLSATNVVDALTYTNTAYALDIASGASLPVLQIDAGATISAAAGGTSANATAIRDQSNTLATITSSGYIASSITPGDFNSDGVADTAVYRPVAIDLHSNTIGTAISLTDVESDAYAAPYIAGDVLLGAGNDSITLKGASVTGNIDFGAGANALSLDIVGTTQSTVLGKLTGTGTVAIDLINGNLGLLSGSNIKASSLHVGAKSALFLELDPTTSTTPLIAGTGSVVFDNDATLKLSLSKIIQTPTRFTLLTGTNIALGNLKTDLTGQVPYIYGATLSTDTPKSTLYADFHVKTQSEFGLSSNEYGAVSAVLTAAAKDSNASNALLSPTDKASFLKIYSQFLPDYSGETFLTLAKGAESVGKTLGTQSRLPALGESQYWVQETGFNINRDHDATTGYEATGFNFAGGYERGLSSRQAAGMYMSVTSSAPLDTYALAKEKYSIFDFGLGGYWRLYDGPLKAWAHLGAGYASFDSTREALSSYVAQVSEASWKGVSVTGGAGASIRYTLGPVSLKPQASLSYYGLKEDAHQETGGGDSFDLSVGERTSHLMSGRFQVAVGRKNADALVQPEFWLGYQNNAAVKLADTVAHFNNGSDFTLSGALRKGGGPVAGFRVAADNEYSHFSIEGEYEKQDDYTNATLSLRARFQF